MIIENLNDIAGAGYKAIAYFYNTGKQIINIKSKFTQINA